MPTAPARAPQTSSMVSKKLSPAMTSPSSHVWLATAPVSRAVPNTSARAASMPLRRCPAGPGVSVMLRHRAPVATVRPGSKWPSRASSTAGSSTDTVTRTPSVKFWPEKKY